tara:strand:+ start:1314 stop:1640 length:327 start_codon:yes stop_codon:yes gene_type:complete
MRMIAPIENYVNYNKAHGFIYILAYNRSEEEAVGRGEEEEHCVNSLTLLSNIFKNSQGGSFQYSVTPCDYRGTGEKEDGDRTQAILAASTMLLHFYSYPQGRDYVWLL